MTAAPGIADIRTAAERIRGFVRRTPLLAAAPAREHPDLARGLLLKLECLQVTGSFKARGAINAVLVIAAGEVAPRHRHRLGRQSRAGGRLCRPGRRRAGDDLPAALGRSPRRSTSSPPGALASSSPGRPGTTATSGPAACRGAKGSPISTPSPIPPSSPARGRSRSRSSTRRPASIPCSSRSAAAG